MENQTFSPLEESLRHQGQELLNITENWEKEERLQIDRLFQRAMILFIISVVVFLALGIVVAFYLSRMLVQPLFQMQQAMDKIAHGDFTPLPEPRILFGGILCPVPGLQPHDSRAGGASGATGAIPENCRGGHPDLGDRP